MAVASPSEGEVALPTLQQKPSSAEILDCLEKLRVEPPVWDLSVTRDHIVQKELASAFHRREAISYLSAIVKSRLSWIDDADQREQIWDQASKRLAERCGRAAMGDILRRWPFHGEGYTAFDLTIREPSVTGDALGFKTWGSSYVLANQLHRLASGPLCHLFTSPDSTAPVEVLELGSGTGLLGLAASCIWNTRVILTDVPGIIPNLAHNIELNRCVAKRLGGDVDVAALTWGGSEEESDERFKTAHQYQLLLAADSIYDDDHPLLLANTIDSQMSLDSAPRVLVMAPLRDNITRDLLLKFKSIMVNLNAPLVCCEEGTVFGQDDWGEDDDSHQVECWWGIFRRRMPVDSIRSKTA